jgi:hypothetical protein
METKGQRIKLKRGLTGQLVVRRVAQERTRRGSDCRLNKVSRISGSAFQDPEVTAREIPTQSIAMPMLMLMMTEVCA